MKKEEMFDALNSLLAMYECSNFKEVFIFYYEKFKDYNKEYFFELLDKVTDVYTYTKLPNPATILKIEKELKQEKNENKKLFELRKNTEIYTGKPRYLRTEEDEKETKLLYNFSIERSILYRNQVDFKFDEFGVLQKLDRDTELKDLNAFCDLDYKNYVFTCRILKFFNPVILKALINKNIIPVLEKSFGILQEYRESLGLTRKSVLFN